VAQKQVSKAWTGSAGRANATATLSGVNRTLIEGTWNTEGFDKKSNHIGCSRYVLIDVLFYYFARVFDHHVQCTDYWMLVTFNICLRDSYYISILNVHKVFTEELELRHLRARPGRPPPAQSHPESHAARPAVAV